MSIRVNLEFRTDVDLELLEEGINLRIIRLYAFMQFRTHDDWTRKFKAILDTGNPVSVIPRFIWQNAEVSWLSNREIRLKGIGEASVSGRLGRITVVFADENKVSPPVDVRAYMLDDNNVPLLIGFEGILTDLDLFCSYRTKTAFLEL
jgi:hypothetical protein